MGADKYNQPDEGTPNWDEPLNENFADLGVEVVDEVATFDDLPTPDSGAVTSDGLPRKILVRQSRVVYRDTGSSWEAVAGLGSDGSRVPGTVYHERHDTAAQIVDGSQLYVQDTEPADADEDDVWIDTS